jgi:hypothetical protein
MKGGFIEISSYMYPFVSLQEQAKHYQNSGGSAGISQQIALGTLFRIVLRPLEKLHKWKFTFNSETKSTKLNYLNLNIMYHHISN